MSREKRRRYNKRRRAVQEERTRRRITEAAVELHGSQGPARTTVSAIATKAGVQRATVYRHFPDEEALFAACSSHWSAAHPLPEIEQWAAIADADERLEVALDELYAYYRRGESMLGNLLRDQESVAVLRPLMAEFWEFLSAGRDVLTAGRGAHGHSARRIRAAVGHALAFATWRSLTRDQGLRDREAVKLMVRAVAAAR